MLTFTVEELIRFLSNWTMTFFEGAKRSGDIVFSAITRFSNVRFWLENIKLNRSMLWFRTGIRRTIRSHPFHDSQNGNLAALL